MTKLPKSLGIALLAMMAGPATAQIQPLDLSGIQSQAQGIIQQQSVGGQINSLQLQQNIQRDRIRELDLFRPQQPHGATSVFQPPGAFLPQPSGLAPLPEQAAPTPAPAPKTE
jgi:hypothetical protein